MDVVRFLSLSHTLCDAVSKDVVASSESEPTSHDYDVPCWLLAVHLLRCGLQALEDLTCC